jgi:hypothetical protein
MWFAVFFASYSVAKNVKSLRNSILVDTPQRRITICNMITYLHNLWDRTIIIGFVGFVVLTYEIDQQMTPRSASEKVRPKKSYFSPACEYVKLSFPLRVPKTIFIRTS